MNLIHFPKVCRINDRFFTNSKHKKVYNDNSGYFINSSYVHTLADQDKMLNQNHEYFDNFSFIKKSFVLLITETVGEYPYPYLTEKTWRTILYKMPFMIIGGKHSLKLLKSFGFETFNEYWNEDYDNFEKLADRVDMVTQNLANLSELKNNELDNLYQKMLPIVEHNCNHLEIFYKKQQNDIKEKLENL